MAGHRRWVRAAAVVIGVAAPAALLVRRLDPWPAALIIRYLFDRDSARVTAALRAHEPAGIRVTRDQRYRPDDADALLDIYSPADADGPLPAVVWIHGGAWLSGSKANVAGYFRLIARQGYVVVPVDYSLAPAATYPTAVRQIDDALRFLTAQADRFGIDPGRIVLAGDSAGAQLVSQIAALTTTPELAAELGLRPALSPGQLRGVILHCGYYDMRTFLDRGRLAPAPFRWAVATMVRAYTGSRDHDSAALRQMSTIDHVTGAFPAALIAGGNADPLTDAHSRPFAGRLTELGVAVTTLFFEPDHRPRLGHEFQFDLDNPDGREVLARTIAFLADRTGRAAVG